jgi:hypothetical protein
MRRTNKWHRKIFFWLLEVSIVNSYLLYILVQEDCSKKPITQKNFRQCPVESLMKKRPLVEECRRLSKADSPVAHMMKD